MTTMLKVLKALMNRLRERFALPKSRLKGSICSVRLSLEEFEPRVTPTTFIWTNVTSNGLWTDPANWLGEAGAPRGSYPGWNGNARTTTDIAEFWGPKPVPTNTPATL